MPKRKADSYELIGGGVGRDEKEQEAACREVREETLGHIVVEQWVVNSNTLTNADGTNIRIGEVENGVIMYAFNVEYSVEILNELLRIEFERNFGYKCEHSDFRRYRIFGTPEGEQPKLTPETAGYMRKIQNYMQNRYPGSSIVKIE